MNGLHSYLTMEVNVYAALAGKNATPEQVANVVAGLSNGISEYLAVLIPEQVENETDVSE